MFGARAESKPGMIEQIFDTYKGPSGSITKDATRQVDFSMSNPSDLAMRYRDLFSRQPSKSYLACPEAVPRVQGAYLIVRMCVNMFVPPEAWLRLSAETDCAAV